MDVPPSLSSTSSSSSSTTTSSSPSSPSSSSPSSSSSECNFDRFNVPIDTDFVCAPSQIPTNINDDSTTRNVWLAAFSESIRLEQWKPKQLAEPCCAKDSFGDLADAVTSFAFAHHIPLEGYPICLVISDWEQHTGYYYWWFRSLRNAFFLIWMVLLIVDLWVVFVSRWVLVGDKQVDRNIAILSSLFLIPFIALLSACLFS